VRGCSGYITDRGIRKCVAKMASDDIHDMHEFHRDRCMHMIIARGGIQTHEQEQSKAIQNNKESSYILQT
jgi:hypothetical protein